MKRIIVLAVAALSASPAMAEKPVAGSGFTCTSATGQVRRLNIDLKRKKFQNEGENPRSIDSSNEATITLVGLNPDLHDTPLGPVYHTVELDRRSLMLSTSSQVPDRNINEVKQFQCVRGPAIDFGPGRQF